MAAAAAATTTTTRVLLSRFRSVILARHGNTLTAHRDFDRPLSDLGHEQCMRARRTWLPAVERRFRITMAVHSTALRCGETLQGILYDDEGGEEGRPPPIADASLYDDILQPKAKGLWEACGYAPISDYFAQPGGRAFLLSYADTVLSSLVELSASHGGDGGHHSDGGNDRGGGDAGGDGGDGGGVASRPPALMVVGHSMYLNAVAYRMAEHLALPDADKELSLATKLAEADGFLVQKGGGASHAAPSSSMQLLSSLPGIIAP